MSRWKKANIFQQTRSATVLQLECPDIHVIETRICWILIANKNC